jgi:hypothetical protein
VAISACPSKYGLYARLAIKTRSGSILHCKGSHTGPFADPRVLREGENDYRDHDA